jgi:NodT family efflux transporter outer membrane factor (OMF) lipoprotein
MVLGVLTCGCTSLEEYVHNGFKVGPNYSQPPAPVAPHWIDANDQRVKSEEDDLSKWWIVFHDPLLDSLICEAYNQNLTLRVAGYRILEARAQRNIDIGNLFPQTQQANASYTRTGSSREIAQTANSTLSKRWFDQWEYGFNLNWELDFWGRYRRSVESDTALLEASVFNYQDVLVTLLGDVATAYVNYRMFQQQIVYAKQNIKLLSQAVEVAEGLYKQGLQTELDPLQARTILEQTQATVPLLEIGQRQAANQLCILLGIAPQDMDDILGTGPIPTTPVEVAVGIPADLLRRRPEVRAAERNAAAQSAQIGVAESEFYPHIAISGTFGWAAEKFKNLFNEQAFQGTIGPTFQWNILNYGRILNNVRLQDARFQELVTTYQNTVLSAAQEVENGLVTFLKSQEEFKYQSASVRDAEKAVDIALRQYKAGTITLTPLILLEQNLVTQQNTQAAAQAQIALGLIQVYRALGGGWELACQGCEVCPPGGPGTGERQSETLPQPQQMNGSGSPQNSAGSGKGSSGK